MTRRNIGVNKTKSRKLSYGIIFQFNENEWYGIPAQSEAAILPKR